jgi:hypothetical protein
MVDLEELQRPLAPEIGQVVTVAGRAGTRRALHLNQPLGPRVLDERLEHRERQTHALGDHQTSGFGAVQRLDDQLVNAVNRQTGVFDRRRRRRHRCGVRYVAR